MHNEFCFNLSAYLSCEKIDSCNQSLNQWIGAWVKSLLGQRIKSYDNLYFPHQIVIDASLFFISHFEKFAGICFLYVLVLYSKNVLS